MNNDIIMGNTLFSKKRKKNYRYGSYDDNNSFERLLSDSYNNNSRYESYKVFETYKIFKRYETVYESRYEYHKKVNKLEKILKKKKKKRRKKFTWRRINSNDFSDSESKSISTSDVEVSYLDYCDLTRK